MEERIDNALSADVSAPRILINPMPQRSEIRHEREDWTGKSSTSERRKLQNRLNKRASRRRRKMKPKDSSVAQRDSDFEKDHLYNLTGYDTFDDALANVKVPTVYCNLEKQKAILAAPNFSNYLRTPLPVDQKLLTLLHFNLVRALITNVLILGLNPDEMSLDIESPFIAASNGFRKASISLDKVPPTLHPTKLQCTIPHHPEIDIFPFPTYRDNLILAGTGIDDCELCTDLLYGVESSEIWKTTKRNYQDTPFSNSGRTGLIVWDDPWKPESWEIDEGFAIKYKRLLHGCDDLLKSSNYWRSIRGEPQLVLGEKLKFGRGCTIGRGILQLGFPLKM